MVRFVELCPAVCCRILIQVKQDLVQKGEFRSVLFVHLESLQRSYLTRFVCLFIKSLNPVSKEGKSALFCHPKGGSLPRGHGSGLPGLAAVTRVISCHKTDRVSSC